MLSRSGYPFKFVVIIAVDLWPCSWRWADPGSITRLDVDRSATPGISINVKASARRSAALNLPVGVVRKVWTVNSFIRCSTAVVDTMVGTVVDTVVGAVCCRI
jgi:hypothetical protein